jgi:predicted negative regulator of RcsB-dependent stress response
MLSSDLTQLSRELENPEELESPEELENPERLAELRQSVAALILAHLHELQAAQSQSERVHVGNAIAALAMNVNAVNQPSRSWLRLCLADLQRAIKDVDCSAMDVSCAFRVDALTLDELIATVEALRTRI